MQDRTDFKVSVQKAEFLSVRVGGQEYAMDIRSVREIRGWITTTKLPYAPDFIKGMINLRGNVLVVIDLARRLGVGDTEPSPASVIVVAEHGQRAVGLLVDAVCDIVTVTDEMRQKTPDTGSNLPKSYIDGLVMMEDRIISILSIAAVIPDEQLQAMAEEITA